LEKNQHARWLVPYQPHSFAALQVVLSALLSSGTLVFSETRDVKAHVGAVEAHAITHISATPTFWRAFLLAAPAQEFSSVQQITLGGEAVDQATLDRLKIAFPQARVSHIYASSEAGTLFSVHDGRAGFPAAWLDDEIRGSVRLRIRDGELEVLTPRRMRSYASGQPTPVRSDGWLMTGDLVERRGDRVVFCGRTDRIINVAGLKVCPEEVEEFLMNHPGIREAKVYSIPSPVAGQLIGAELIVDPAFDSESVVSDLRTSCATQLPPHKRPRSFSCVPHIATTESGKKA
jgi:acyl-CoA synthetase (AMP-forming)/AMP-acid ligase II